jgi:hypothetical protein
MPKNTSNGIINKILRRLQVIAVLIAAASPACATEDALMERNTELKDTQILQDSSVLVGEAAGDDIAWTRQYEHSRNTDAAELLRFPEGITVG